MGHPLCKELEIVRKHRIVLALKSAVLPAGLFCMVVPVQVVAEEIDSEVTVNIREEGFSRSHVMDLARMMTDVYGPRYANSSAYDDAARWAKAKLEEFGLENVRLEAWGEFGYGWQNTHTSIHMTAPRYQPVIGYPVPGSRGTGGVLTGKIVAIDTSEIFEAEDLELWRGKLTSKIVLVSPARELKPNFEPQAVRLSDEELRDMARLEIERLDTEPSSYGESQDKDDSGHEPLPRAQIEEFLAGQGVEVLVETGSANVGPMDKGVVHVSGDGTLPFDQPKSMPRIVVAPEHYNRMMRLLDNGFDVEMEIEVRNDFRTDDPLDYNVLAEIPGSDLANEIVLIGAHFDSEPAGTGATDNASGSAIVMEAMRILAAIDAKPRRTIRLALWGAEEVGVLGSRGYVKKHLGDREAGTVTAAHEDFSVYFNVDWYGRFRGIFLQGNDAARPIFEAWMAPFEDVGMSWIVPGNTGGTDHVAFLEVGLPGFQFIQDDLEFFNVTFHTNMDVYDRLVAEDLKQASVILASFAYHAAMRDEKFPRADGLDNGRRWHK
jgi:hypothetical protein